MIRWLDASKTYYEGTRLQYCQFLLCCQGPESEAESFKSPHDLTVLPLGSGEGSRPPGPGSSSRA